MPFISFILPARLHQVTWVLNNSLILSIDIHVGREKLLARTSHAGEHSPISLLSPRARVLLGENILRIPHVTKHAYSHIILGQIVGSAPRRRWLDGGLWPPWAPPSSEG